MLRCARRLAVPSLGVGFLPLLALWIPLAGGMLAAACVSAAPSGSLAQAGIDSVRSNTPIPRVAPAAPTTPPTAAPTTPPTVTPSPPQQRDPFTLHLQGGLFTPIDVNAPSPTIGLRLGRLLLPHLQGGLLTSWTLRTKDREQPVDTRPGLSPQRVLGRVDAHLVPVMAFLQLNLTEKRFLVPYAAVAAGYEWFSVVASDYIANQQARASYANVAWEGWGGFGMRLEQGLRADVEVFYNGGNLKRDVTDSSGTWRETVDMNGVGARVGLDILF